MVSKCPVCNSELVEDYKSFLEYMICELTEHCPNGCSDFEFAYGNYRERIGERIWEYSYTDSGEDEMIRRQEQKVVIERLKCLKSIATK